LEIINVALGTLTLSATPVGTDNTAIGNLALQNSANTSNHVCVGRLAVWDHRRQMIILSSGHHTGVPVAWPGMVSVCYIDNIYGANVDDTTGFPVSCSSIPMEVGTVPSLPAEIP